MIRFYLFFLGFLIPFYADFTKKNTFSDEETGQTLAFVYTQILPKNELEKAILVLEKIKNKTPQKNVSAAINYLKKCQSAGTDIDFIYFYQAFVTPSVSIFNSDFFREKAVKNREKKAELGRILFFDPILSANGKRSCASCHRPEKAFCDQRTTSRAFLFAENLNRNAPSLINSALSETHFFHEGQHQNLAGVFEAVITNPKEFNFSYSEILARLQTSEDYRALFKAAFDKKNVRNEVIRRAELDESLAEYLKILRGYDGVFDKMMRTQKTSKTENIGYQLFMSKAQCGSCHAPPSFSGSQKPFSDSLTRHFVGTVWLKIPSLRNLELSAPYGYDGRVRTLDAIFDEPFHAKNLAEKGILLNSNDRETIRQFLQSLNDASHLNESEPKVLPQIEGFEKRQIGGSY